MTVAFSKAKPKQARLKVSVYGPPGSGKTFTTLLFAEGLAAERGKRIAYVDTERGTDFYAQEVPSRQVHPEAFDFDAVYTRSIAEVTQAVHSINPKTHGVIVIDSISHLWDAAMDAYAGKRNKNDAIPMHAWGKIKRPYKDLIKWLIGSPFDVFILGRQKNVFEDDTDGQMKKVGVAMRAEGETAYEPHICARMECIQDQADSTRSTVTCLVEKDRTGVLSGRRIASPNFETIRPLLPLLGDEQAGEEDEDERLALDAELMEKQDEKRKAKAEKSAGILADMQAKIAGAMSVEDLGAVGKEIKKLKRNLIEEHQDALRVLYEQRRSTIVAEVVGEAF